jgi:hypothetical protein
MQRARPPVGDADKRLEKCKAKWTDLAIRNERRCSIAPGWAITRTADVE